MVCKDTLCPGQILFYHGTVITHFVGDLVFFLCGYLAVHHHIHRIARHHIQKSEYQYGNGKNKQQSHCQPF